MALFSLQIGWTKAQMLKNGTALVYRYNDTRATLHLQMAPSNGTCTRLPTSSGRLGQSDEQGAMIIVFRYISRRQVLLIWTLLLVDDADGQSQGAVISLPAELKGVHLSKAGAGVIGLLRVVTRDGEVMEPE